MQTIILLLATVVWTAHATTLLPSTNIFTPPWLYQQRRARHLLAQPQYLLPQYQTYPGSSYSARTLPTAYHTSNAYIVQPYPQVLAAPVQWSPRPYYQTPLVHYLTPVASHSSFAKRIDQQPAEKQSDDGAQHQHQGSTPCLLHSGPSEHYPVYVLPPKNFQPIVYHQQGSLGSYLSSVPLVQYQPTTADSNKVKSAEELWYDSDSNTDGKVKGTKTQQDNEIDLSSNRKKIVYVPVVDSGYSQFPVYEAVIQEVKPTAEETSTKGAKQQETKAPSKAYEAGGNWYSGKQTQRKDTRRYRTKLPVGMTSFFLGGIRGVSGRHWNMPASLVKNLEFMPNASPMSPENKYLPEESYVKQVDDQTSAAPIPGDPEKEDTQEQTPKTTDSTKKIFEQNTIIDSPLDLEAQESSHQKQQAPTVSVDRTEQETKKQSA